MTYTTLIRGDIRQKGDEVKPRPESGMCTPHKIKAVSHSNWHLEDYWQPVSPGLLGIEIDFHHVKTAEYRRPVK